MHLEEDGDGAPHTLGLTAYLQKETLRGDALDHMDEGSDVLHLVRLQRPDEVPDEVGIALTEALPLLYQLLHTALAEEALACSVRHLDILRRVELRHGHQPCPTRQRGAYLIEALSYILTSQGLHIGRRLRSACR